MDSEEAQTGRPDAPDGRKIGAGNPAEEWGRAAGGHYTEKARHRAHEEELSSRVQPPPAQRGGVGMSLERGRGQEGKEREGRALLVTYPSMPLETSGSVPGSAAICNKHTYILPHIANTRPCPCLQTLHTPWTHAVSFHATGHQLCLTRRKLLGVETFPFGQLKSGLPHQKTTVKDTMITALLFV